MTLEQEPRDPFPLRITPIHPRMMYAVPRNESVWTSETKLKGIRGISYVNHGRVDLTTRNNRRITENFPRIVAGLAVLGNSHNFILDGELISGEGKTSADEIDVRSRAQSNPRPLQLPTDRRFRYMVFDLVYLDGKDLSRLQIEDRREFLEELIPTDFWPEFGIGINPYNSVNHAAYVERIRQQGFEGVVFKRKGSRYIVAPGVRRPWSKIKFRQE